MAYYNYPRMIKDLYAIMGEVGKDYDYTLRLMLDECVMHFLEAHNIAFEKQGEFLGVMLYDCPQVLADYKNKKFDYHK